MKKIALAILLLGAAERTCFAQSDGCQAPANCPPTCATTRSLEQPTPRSLETPRGTYVRAPETGEQTGESTQYGLRGFGLRLPAMSFDLPELRLPGLVKYRRLPEMQVESSRAPWVEQRALEFNQVPRSFDEEKPKPNDRSLDVTPRENCVPPTPGVGQNERRLREQLAQKEQEIQQMQEQFTRLETMVNRLSEAKQRELDMEQQTSRRSQPPRIIEVAFAQEATEVKTPKRLPQTTQPTRTANSSGPKPCRPVKAAK